MNNLLYVGVGLPEIIVLLTGIAIMALIFYAIRSLVLWYWKVDIIVSNLVSNNKLLQHQITLLDEQLKVLKEIKSQSGNNPTDTNAEPLRP